MAATSNTVSDGADAGPAEPIGSRPLSAEGVAASIARLADTWRAERPERLRRTQLDTADVDAVIAAGYPALIVPRSHGGLWEGRGTVRHIADALGALARVDPSLALVLSMHPAVLSYWVGAPAAPAPHRRAWEAQRVRFFDRALAGELWGTVTSEPGSGGDMLRTRSVAEAIPTTATETHRLHGQKHFGSGFGVLPFMITTALVPDDHGTPFPDVFVLDLRQTPVAGVTVTRPWDGAGMRATQSDAVELDGAVAERAAWPFGVLTAVPFATAVMLPLWVTIVASVIDEAVTELHARLDGKRSSLRPFEAAEWVRIDIEHFQIRRIADGLCPDLPDLPGPDGPPEPTAVIAAAALDALRAKLAVAELAESVMARVSRVAGGGSFSSGSPFAAWYEDVRALGFLRPPWALGVDQVLAATLADDSVPDGT